MVASRNSTRSDLRLKLILVGVLLLAAFIRWYSLAETNTMLHHDEAFNGVDALGLIEEPRLTVFFPGNFGREGAWFYWLVPFLLSAGARPFALRLAATFMGILAVAASFRLGKELLGSDRGGMWAALALAFLYWHVHLSTLALRANMMPFVGAMAFAYLLRARRTGERGQWLAGGGWLGLLAYTYFSARSWILLALLALGWWLLRPGGACPRLTRRNIIRAGAVAALVALPLVIYSLTHPVSLERMQDVGVFGLSEILGNVRAWALAWFQVGDSNVEFNLPGRPILDPFIGILFLVGVGGFGFVARRRAYVVWPFALLFFALLPSLLSDYAPHSLRAIGAVIPVAVFVGAGALLLERVARRTGVPVLPVLLPLVLFGGTGVLTFRTYHQQWVRGADIYVTMERHTARATRYLDEEVAPGTMVYFSPLAPDHPNLRFNQLLLDDYQVGAFDSHQCLMVADEPAVYTTLTMYEPGFAEQMRPFMTLETLYEDRVEWSERPAFTIYRATPQALQPEQSAVFGDRLQVELLTPLAERVAAGGSVPLQLRVRALRSLETHYSVFVHLYTLPPPEEGGSLVTQADDKLCPAYPTPAWKLNESAIESFSLALPAEVAAGEYLVAVGIYESWPPYTRLPLTAVGGAEGATGDYLPVGTIRVGDLGTE